MQTNTPPGHGDPDPQNQLAVHRALQTWARALVESLKPVGINTELIGEVISSGVRNAERIVVRYHTNLWNAARGHALIELSRHAKEQKRRVEDKLREYNRFVMGMGVSRLARDVKGGKGPFARLGRDLQRSRDTPIFAAI